MIKLKKVCKTYKTRSENITALNNVSLSFPQKGLIFVLGKSGCGKSTLLNVIGGLDNYDDGEILIENKSTKEYKAKDFDEYRNEYIGFVFQEFNLIKDFTIGKNIEISLELQRRENKKELAKSVLAKVGLGGYYNRKVSELSGGQKQRVAIARAIIKNPKIILADEPTGNLDSETSVEVFDLLKELSKETLVLVVTHDGESANEYGDAVLEMKNGEIIKADGLDAMLVAENELAVVEYGEKLNTNDTEIVVIEENAIDENDIAIIDKENTEKGKSKRKKHKKANGSLPASSVFRYAFSNIWKKKIRIVASIVLFFFAITMFSLSQAASNYTMKDAAYKTLLDNDYKYINMKYLKEEPGKDAYENLMYDFGIDIFEKDYFLPLYLSGGIDFVDDPFKDHSYYKTHTYSFAIINEQILKNFGFELLHGRLPVGNNEVCISKYTAESIIYNENTLGMDTFIDENIPEGERDLTMFDGYYRQEVDLSNIESLINKTYSDITIVGIVDTKLSSENDIFRTFTLSEQYRGGFLQEKHSDFLNEVHLIHSKLFVGQKHFDERYIVPGLSGGISAYYMKKDYTYIPYRSLEILRENLAEETGKKLHKVSSSDEGYYLSTYDVNLILTERGYVLTDDSIKYYMEILQENEIMLELNYASPLSNDEYYINERIIGIYEQGENDVIFSNGIIERLKVELACVTSVLVSLGNKKTIYKALEMSRPIDENAEFLIFGNYCVNEVHDKHEIANNLKNIGALSSMAFAFFAIILLLNYFMTTIKDNGKEIGILKALGTKTRNIFGIYCIEAIFVSVIAFVCAIPTAIIVADIYEKSLRQIMPNGSLSVFVRIMLFDGFDILLTLLLSVSIALLGCILPFINIMRKKPIDLIREGK